MEPSIDLILKHIRPHHLIWRGSNKAVSPSLKRRCPGSIAEAFQVCCANGFWFTSHLSVTYIFVVMTGCTSFSLLFQNFTNFQFRG